MIWNIVKNSQAYQAEKLVEKEQMGYDCETGIGYIHIGGHLTQPQARYEFLICIHVASPDLETALKLFETALRDRQVEPSDYSMVFYNERTNVWRRELFK